MNKRIVIVIESETKTEEDILWNKLKEILKYSNASWEVFGR